MGYPVASVLVVDDNADFLTVIRETLEEGSPAFRVHTAETGAAALALLERQRGDGNTSDPAFVVLDFHLEDMDAPLLLNRLAASSGLRDVPVLVLSVSGWDEDEEAARSAGARHFLVKPTRCDELHEAIVAFWRDNVAPSEGPVTDEAVE